MKKTTGFYPRPRVDTSGRAAVGQAGGVLLTSTVRAAGLDAALSAAMAPWRPAGAVHDPAKVLLDLALTLALGGDTCSDLAVVRAEPAVFGPVASDPTASRTIARLAADVERVLPAIDRARAGARARAWAAAGTTRPGPRRRRDRGAVGDRAAARQRRVEHRRRSHRGAARRSGPAARAPARSPAQSQGAGADRRGRVDPQGHRLAHRAAPVVLGRVHPAREHPRPARDHPGARVGRGL